MLFSRRKINDDNGPVCGDGPLEIPKQTYLVESVVIGFALVDFRFVMAGGFININLLKWESNTESHEIGTTTVTVSVAGSAWCGAVLFKGTVKRSCVIVFAPVWDQAG